IGAYGQELSDVLHSIEFLDAATYEPRRMHAAELELGYRDSVIKQGLEGVVLSIDVLLHDETQGAGEVPLSRAIAYGQLAAALGVNIGDRVPLHTVRETVLRLRASKGMVLDEADHDSWSAGSFFTNPMVGER